MITQIIENAPLTASVYRMRLRADTSDLKRPGQFVQVSVPGFYLRRPISVCDWDAEGLTLVYKVLGQGTDRMSRMRTGETLDILSGLGNGFDTGMLGERPLLVGGGVGLPPLLGLGRRLCAEGKKPRLLAGFNTAGETFLTDEFEAMGIHVTLTTADGSAGIKGLVTDALPRIGDLDSLAACGPLPMLKALHAAVKDVPALYSLEERMGCGFGACMGCSLETANGPKRVCREGPVFRGEELMWS